MPWTSTGPRTASPNRPTRTMPGTTTWRPPPTRTVPVGPIGDRLILADLGVSERELLALDPNDALSEIAEVLGAAEVLETVR